MAFCKNCGTEINKGVNFCPSCGKAAGAASSSESAQAKQSRQKEDTAGGKTGKQTTEKPSAGGTGIGSLMESSSQKLAEWKKRAGDNGTELFIIGLLENFLAVMKKYTVVEGRASRREFWLFVLVSFIVGVAFAILGIIPIVNIITGLASFLYSIVTIIPSITVGVRRLHDTNKSGMLMLLLLIPFVGWIIVIVLCALQGTQGENNYGPPVT